MNRRALVAVFVVALFLLLAATLPLRLAISAGAGGFPDRLELSAAEASGTLWSGQLRAVTWRGRPQGDVAVSLRPLSLLAGTRRVRLSAPAFSIDLLQGRRTGFEHARGRLELAVREPLAGTLALSLDDAGLVFGDGTCRHATGRVMAEFSVEGLEQPLQLAGPVACDRERGAIPLAARAPGAIPVEARVSIDARGRYEVRSLVRPTDAATTLALRAAGFVPTPDGLARTDGGHLPE